MQAIIDLQPTVGIYERIPRILRNLKLEYKNIFDWHSDTDKYVCFCSLFDEDRDDVIMGKIYQDDIVDNQILVTTSGQFVTFKLDELEAGISQMIQKLFTLHLNDNEKKMLCMKLRFPEIKFKFRPYLNYDNSMDSVSNTKLEVYFYKDIIESFPIIYEENEWSFPMEYPINSVLQNLNEKITSMIQQDDILNVFEKYRDNKFCSWDKQILRRPYGVLPNLLEYIYLFRFDQRNILRIIRKYESQSLWIYDLNNDAIHNQTLEQALESQMEIAGSIMSEPTTPVCGQSNDDEMID